MTFCHRYNLSEGDSVVSILTDIRSSQLDVKGGCNNQFVGLKVGSLSNKKLF